jgi:two-component system, cell cycle sensor histidine kinase and response regulator CckA
VVQPTTLRTTLFSSLRSRLVLLVLLAVLPALAMVLYTAVEQRAESVEQVQQRVQTLSSLLAADQEKEFAQASLLLRGLARLPVVRSGTAKACSEVLAAVHQSLPRFLNLGVIAGADGSVLCSVVEVPEGGRLSPAGMEAVREGLRSGGFAVSGYTVGQLSGRPLVMLVHAVDGNRALYAPFSLDALAQGLANVDLPNGTTLTVVDREGVVLARHPANGAWVGLPLNESLSLLLPSNFQSLPPSQAYGLDGVDRFYASTPMRLTDGTPFGHVLVGVPVEEALAPVEDDLRRHLIWLALVTMVALGAAWFGADVFVLRRVDALLLASHRLEAGDLRARSGIPAGDGELERLGGAFDRMAESLETRQRDAERAAAKLRRQALVLDTLLEGVIVTDPQGTIIDLNPAAEQLFGYTRAELVGRRPDVFHAPEMEGRVEEEILLAMETEGRWTGEIAFQRKDGSRGFSEAVIVAQYNGAGERIAHIGVNRDVTERHAAEEALRQREEELRQAQKMEAVGRLAGGIAHDFNNLLTAIKGNTELALLDLPLASPIRAEIEQVRQAADTATSLTRQLLSFSRKQAVQPQAVGVNHLIESTSRLLTRLIGASVELECELAPELWSVRADPGQIEQVLMNLAVNARDAMPDGGLLRLSTENMELTARDPRRPSYVRPGRYVLLSVSDNGEGMDPQVQERVFEPFFTTKEKEKGTGLGLFTVYGIVRQCGGHVWVESTPGGGTTVRILLPHTETGAAMENGNGPAELEPGMETVLLVEDEAPVRLLAQRLLERTGYHVLVASDGEQALEVSDGYEGSIHLLLTDMTMPRMGGAEVARKLRARRPAINVVFMSGYTEESLAGETGPDGAAPLFVQKPFTLDVLSKTIRQALDSAPRGG